MNNSGKRLPNLGEFRQLRHKVPSKGQCRQHGFVAFSRFLLIQDSAEQILAPIQCRGRSHFNSFGFLPFGFHVLRRHRLFLVIAPIVALVFAPGVRSLSFFGRSIPAFLVESRNRDGWRISGSWSLRGGGGRLRRKDLGSLLTEDEVI